MATNWMEQVDRIGDALGMQGLHGGQQDVMALGRAGLLQGLADRCDEAKSFIGVLIPADCCNQMIPWRGSAYHGDWDDPCPGKQDRPNLA